MRMRKGVFFLMFLAAARLAAAERDPKAEAVGRELIQALGGQEAWEKARQFRFDFVVEREGRRAASFSHSWDRYTGDYRLRGTEQSGAPYEVFFNVNTRQGQAFVNGRPAEGEAQGKLLETAYRRFINDTYWLLAPWKIFDPGVNLAYDGEKSGPEGELCDVVRLSFDTNVGLTPKDVYWFWITRQGRQMVQWQYVLGGAQEEPTATLWKGWKSFAGVSISLEKTMAARPVVIRFENVSVSGVRDETTFTPPSP